MNKTTTQPRRPVSRRLQSVVVRPKLKHKVLLFCDNPACFATWVAMHKLGTDNNGVTGVTTAGRNVP